jgi:hypothetical protein
MKRFKVLETNLDNVPSTHFMCTTPISTYSEVFGENFRCTRFDGLKIKLVKDDKYILGELHG